MQDGGDRWAEVDWGHSAAEVCWGRKSNETSTEESVFIAAAIQHSNYGKRFAPLSDGGTIASRMNNKNRKYEFKKLSSLS